MTISPQPSEPATPPLGQTDEASSMRAAAQWLATAAGAVGAALIAGLQIGDLGTRVRDPASFTVAILAFLAALLTVGLTLRRAGAVLVTSRATIDDLLSAETRLRRKDQRRIRFEKRQDPALKEIVKMIADHREWLMPGRDSVWALSDAWKEAQEAATAARDGSPGAAERRAEAAGLQRQVDGVCTFARCELTRRAYRSLSRTVTGMPGVFFIASLAVLAVALNWPADEPPAVTTPYRVDVLLTGDDGELREEGLSGACTTGMRLTGVALDGSLTEPVVVTEAEGACPASRFTVTETIGIPVPYVPAK